MSTYIGDVKIDGKAVLAPMAGVTDKAYREICKEFGACYVVSEMVSSKGILYYNKNTLELMTISNKERPCAIQLFGNEPDIMSEASKLIEDKFNPDMIDINMGCPAPKIVSNGCGSAMMKNPILCGKVVEYVKKSVSVPVTVKIRKGWDINSVNAVEISKICEESGADAITVHGRTKSQMYAPKADWEIIKNVKNNVKIPVIANGDVFTATDSKNILDATGADLLMIGRGSLGNPWIFSQVNSYLNNGILQDPPSINERINTIKKHVNLMCKYKNEKVSIMESRKLIAWYIKGLHNASKLRKQAFKIDNINDLNTFLDSILADCEI